MAARHRTTLPSLALAALSVATAAGLARVFAGASWVAPAVVAAVLPHLVAIAGRRRNWPEPVVLAGLLAGCTAYGLAVAETPTSFFGLPTGASLRAYLEHLADAPAILRTAVVPVPPDGGALLLAVTALWLMATVAEWLASAAKPTLGPLAPSLVVFVAVAALGSGDHPLVTAGYATAAAGYLLAQHHERTGRHPTFRHARGIDRGLRRLMGGIAAALAAVLVGSLVAPALPGSGSDALLDYRELGRGQGPGKWEIRSPLVDIRTRLVEQPAVELFTVGSPRQAYWRLLALDDFDGQAWTLDAKAPPAGDDLPLDSGIVADSIAVTQQFRIGPLDTRWLPAAYRPRRIALPGALVISESLSLLTAGGSAEGLEYEVVSEIPLPTDTQLAGSPPVRDRRKERYVELPDAFPQAVRSLAYDVTQGAVTPYEQALAIQDWLRDETRFTYTLDAPPGHSDDALVDFLFETRRGYCEQFAGAFAAMARAVNLPTRVAVGFTSGTFDPDAGVWRVTSQDAHAWPEVYLAGIGWTAFEPTPGRYEPSPGDPTRTHEDNPLSPPTTPGQTTPSSVVTRPGAPPPTSAPAGSPEVRVEQPGASGGPRVTRPLAVVVVAAAGVAATALLAGGAAVVASKQLRRSRRRRAAEVRARVGGAWQEALDRLGEAGIVRPASATPVEFALRHAPAHGAGDAGPALMELARLQTAAVFSAHDLDDEAGARAWQHVDRIAGALKTSSAPGERLRRLLDPRTLRPRDGTPRSPRRS